MSLQLTTTMITVTNAVDPATGKPKLVAQGVPLGALRTAAMFEIQNQSDTYKIRVGDLTVTPSVGAIIPPGGTRVYALLPDTKLYAIAEAGSVPVCITFNP